MASEITKRFIIPGPGSTLFGSFHFDEQQGDDAGQGGEGDEGDTGGDGTQGGSEKPLAYRDAQKLIRQRDNAKLVNRAITETLGLEVEWVEDDETGTRKPNIKGLDKIKALLEGGEGDPKPTGNKGRIEQIEQQHAVKVERMKSRHQTEIAGMMDIITEVAVVEPLRAALAAEGAYDDAEGDDAGKFNDLVTLLRPRLKVAVDRDDDDPKPTLSIAVVDEQGKLVTNKAGDPVTIRQYVRDFLNRKPHFRSANFRRGPGAGGSGDAANFAQRGRGKATVAEYAQQQAAAMFGVARSG